MKLSPLLLFASAASFVYAIWLLAAPASLFSLYGVPFSDSALLMGRFFAAALLGLGLAGWLARGIDPAAIRKVVVPAFLISALAGLTVSGLGVYSGLMNRAGLSVVAVYVILTLGFGVAQFKKA